jgi:hypothetical protein
MRRIFKYDIGFLEKQTVTLPKNADILRVETQDGIVRLWAAVDPNETELENRFLECYKTGAIIDTPYDDLRYIGYVTIYIQMELCLYVYENLVPFRNVKNGEVW